MTNRFMPSDKHNECLFHDGKARHSVRACFGREENGARGVTRPARGLFQVSFLKSSALHFFIFALCLVSFVVRAETWQDVLGRMPLGTNVAELNRTNCVKIMLPALQSNDVVKALIFMPGATDEFYFHRRGTASLTNASPTLLDAVSALTNQTLIRATF